MERFGTPFVPYYLLVGPIIIKNEQVATELAEPATWLPDELEMAKTFLIIAPQRLEGASKNSSFSRAVRIWCVRFWYAEGTMAQLGFFDADKRLEANVEMLLYNWQEAVAFFSAVIAFRPR
jgi:hypothetical protein